MVPLIRRRAFLAHHALPLLTLMFFLTLSLLQPFTVQAKERTIVVDENNPPKARKIKPSPDTKVINIRNRNASDKGQAADGDICPALGGYYCKSISKEARLKDGGLYLGTISGVAWREKGQPMGLYLAAAGAETPGAASGEAPEEVSTEPSIIKRLKKNTLSIQDSFYFIIDIEGIDGPVLIEPHRISISE